MSTLAIILIIAGTVILLFLVGGVLGAGRRLRAHETEYGAHLCEADRALEQARASDRGWNRDVLEQAAREALAGSHPGTTFDELDLVLVDDRPGVDEDRAQFAARAGTTEVRLVLMRDASGWHAERSG